MVIMKNFGKKLDAICSICEQPFKCDPNHFNDPKCNRCLNNPGKVSKKELADVMKKNLGYEVRAEINTDGAIMNALMANANAFRAIGGSPMMFTEHVENGIDAIKVLNNWKSTDPPKKLGNIRIIFDDTNSKVIVIDDGSGIEDPIWILNKPLRSRKTSVSLQQTGKYGRGLQGFRGFCETLQYLTLRNTPHESEILHPDNEGFTKNELKGVKLTLIRDSVYGKVESNKQEKFKEHSDSQTGTVAIFSDWIEEEYEQIKKKKKELFERIQHHFRHDLETGLVSLTIESGKKIQNVTPRYFGNENGEFDLFDLPIRVVYDDVTNEEIGTIEYFVYKSSGEYKHNYKQPFLLAKDNRPLQDSFISTMPQMSQYPIWKSPYVTGYIKCNFVEPDNLRVALSIEGENNKKNLLFFNALRADSIELKKLVSEWQSTFIKREQTSENRNIILEIQSFLKTEKIKLDLPDLQSLGLLKDGNDGSQNKGEPISGKPGEEHQGRITEDGDEEVTIFYEKGSYEERGKKGKKGKKKRLKIKVPTKDGKKYYNDVDGSCIIK